MLRALAVGNAVVHTSGEFHTPSLDDFFPPVFAFEGTPFAMNRVMVIRLVMLAIMVILLLVYARRARLVPGPGHYGVALRLRAHLDLGAGNGKDNGS